ncbi:MAG: DPP IV N-terminal domain-containing protein [Kiritimatiellia bacterium]
MKRNLLIIAVIPAIMQCAYAQGSLKIEKTGAARTLISLGLRCRGQAAGIFMNTLEEDLERSGWFTTAAGERAALRVSGDCRQTGKKIEVDCVLSRISGRNIFRKTIQGPSESARRMAHELADYIVESVKGRPGIASTRIAMIRSVNSEKDVYVCDADGRNVLRVTSDRTECLSPAWAPDGNAIVYTSYHGRGSYPDTYSIDLKEGVRKTISAYPGLNVHADVSPDGNRMALILSRDGNPELYVKDLENSRLRRLTRTAGGAEASPSWSPDGRKIVFVSDTTGRPQLYITEADGGAVERLTYRGSENAAPDWGPGGRIAWSSRRGGRYHICTGSPDGGQTRQITRDPGADHEEPTWAPDGRHIAYTRTETYNSSIYLLDTMENTQVRLIQLPGNWYSPAWGPGGN